MERHAGYTLQQVADYLGIKCASRISKWENGEAYPSIINLYKLSALYGTLVDELYYDLRQELQRELEMKKKKNK